jgi:phage shock protein A
MPIFSRLTDIVTCNLTALLAEARDPRAVLAEIVFEMEQGIAGSQRSMKTAGDNETRIRAEIDEQRTQVGYWTDQARTHLSQNDESQARLDLTRRHEVENLIAGLEMQHRAAAATREHLTTTYRALEARLADARRRLTAIGVPAAQTPDGRDAAADFRSSAKIDDVIDEELAALRRELGQH